MFADLLQVGLTGLTALLAGVSWVWPVVGRLGSRQRTTARWTAGIAVSTAVLVALLEPANTLIMTGHAAVTVAALVVLHRRTPAFLAGAALTAMLGVEMSIVDDVGALAYLAGGVVLLGAGVTVAVSEGGSRTARVRRLVPISITALVVVAVGFGFSQVPASVPHHHASPPSEPGVPLLWEGHLSGEHVPVLLTPQRPGRNLVLVGGAADDVRVGADPATMAPVRERAGADGTWATIALPPGPSTLWIERGDDRLSLPVDTGHGAPAAHAVVGADGPECASAALGAALSGGRNAPAACPADALSSADESSLRGVVDFLAARGVHAVTIAADGSPRSSAAAHVVRDAASRNQLSISADAGPEGALVVVSGWEAASATLSAVAIRQRSTVDYGAGIYVAPWLLSASVMGRVGGAIIPLRFDPRDERPVSYKLALASRFHGLSPTASGYHGWLSAQDHGDAEPTRLYATSLVSFLPRDLGSHGHHDQGDWLPGGTVVPVSGPISQGRRTP